MDELDVLGFDQWKTTLACIAIGWEWIEYICTSQILSFTRAGILSYMPKCVYVADLIYWIYSLCLEGWSGLLLAAVAAAEQQQAAQPEAAAQQQRVGRPQMLPWIGTLRGERTPGVWRAQGGGA